MSEKRLVLVKRDARGGPVLERALADLGFEVTLLETGRQLADAEDADAIVLVLDDDDADIFELLIRLATMDHRASVLLLSRRNLDKQVLGSLGVDRLVTWPCRVDQIAAAIESTRWVS